MQVIIAPGSRPSHVIKIPRPLVKRFLIRCIRRESNSHALAGIRSWAVRVYLFRHGRMRAADRPRTGDPDIGNVVLYLLSYNRMRADTGSRTRGRDLGKVAL